MHTLANTLFEPSSDSVVLPSQYNDLIRRHSRGSGGEYRLLWAVLEDAIKSYLSNRGCSTRNQRRAFEEANTWLHSAQGQPRGLFAFESICELLEIDAKLLLKGLDESVQSGKGPTLHRADARGRKAQRLAA